MKRVGIVIASDQGSKGLRLDESGEKIAEMVRGAGYLVTSKTIVPDDIEPIQAILKKLADEEGCHLILTTGGTGFSKRDNTPEATLGVIERQAPGIVEAMRWVSFQKTPKAILSRAVAGIRGDAIIINLPGSPKAVEECLNVILEPLDHGIDILLGVAKECGGKK